MEVAWKRIMLPKSTRETAMVWMALDLVTLKDGRVHVISQDAVVLHKNMEAGEVSGRPTFYI